MNVQLRLGLTLCFLNLEGVDSVVGFEGTPWHAHGLVPFTTVPPEFIECDELDLLTGIFCGDLLVVSRHQGQELMDRWLCHRLEALVLDGMLENERLEVWRFGAGPALKR